MLTSRVKLRTTRAARLRARCAERCSWLSDLLMRPKLKPPPQRANSSIPRRRSPRRSARPLTPRRRPNARRPNAKWPTSESLHALRPSRLARMPPPKLNVLSARLRLRPSRSARRRTMRLLPSVHRSRSTSLHRRTKYRGFALPSKTKQPSRARKLERKQKQPSPRPKLQVRSELRPLNSLLRPRLLSCESRFGPKWPSSKECVPSSNRMYLLSKRTSRLSAFACGTPSRRFGLACLDRSKILSVLLTMTTFSVCSQLLSTAV